MRFSERIGARPVRSALQLNSMDSALRTGLWNSLLSGPLWELISVENVLYRLPSSTQSLVETIWADLLNQPLDDLPPQRRAILALLRKTYFALDWAEAYDFVEGIVACLNDDAVANDLNRVLEREGSGFRFVSKSLVPVTSEVEIIAIEEAVGAGGAFSTVSRHLTAALQLLAARDDPDAPRNSIKESISAVEAACRIVDPKANNLSDALKSMERGRRLHGALSGAFDKLYGWTSDADGIRHAMLADPSVGPNDARFMLVACSAFVGLLISKFER